MSPFMYGHLRACRPSRFSIAIARLTFSWPFTSARVAPPEAPTRHPDSIFPDIALPSLDSVLCASPDTYQADASDNLSKLLYALQTSSPLAVSRLLLTISKTSDPAPGENSSPAAHPAVSLLLRLSSPAFSRLVALLDPLHSGHLLDPGHGIRIPPGLAHFSHVAGIDSAYGVRRIYNALFSILFSAFRERIAAWKRDGPGGAIGDPAPGDYKVLLRLAGACQDTAAVRSVWWYMASAGHLDWRLYDGLHTEFLSARFLTLPLYYQFDYGRVRLRPADLHRSGTALPNQVRKRLRSLRINVGLHRVQRYGLVPNMVRSWMTEQDTLTVSTLLRPRKPLDRKIRSAEKWGWVQDEQGIGAMLIGWARAGARREFKFTLKKYYGLDVREDWDTLRTSVHFAESSSRLTHHRHPRFPTTHLVHAVVDACGSMGDVRLGVQLALAISQRWGIPLTPDVWSSLLSWAYIATTKPFSFEWDTVRSAKPRWRTEPLKPADVKMIWQSMTVQSKMQPTWDENSVRVNTLIHDNDLGAALDAMLGARDWYEDMMRDTIRLFHMLQQSTEALGSESRAVQDLHFAWERSRLRIDLAQNDMRMWLRNWFSKRNRQRSPRENAHESFRLIPKLALAFKPWLPFPLKYRTSTGTVCIFVQGDPTSDQASLGQRQRQRKREPGSGRLVWQAPENPARTEPVPLDVPAGRYKLVRPPAGLLRLVPKGRDVRMPGPGRRRTQVWRPWVRITVRMPRGGGGWWSSMKGTELSEAREAGLVGLWLEPRVDGDLELELRIKQVNDV